MDREGRIWFGGRRQLDVLEDLFHVPVVLLYRCLWHPGGCGGYDVPGNADMGFLFRSCRRGDCGSDRDEMGEVQALSFVGGCSFWGYRGPDILYAFFGRQW